MQLHVCLLLFLLTTAQIQAWSDQQCGGNVSLDQQTGHIRLPLPGLFNDTGSLNLTTQQSDRTVQTCTWILDIPSGRTVLLKLDWSEGGTKISVRCAGSEEELILRSGDVALLSVCDRNKATLSWRGTGRSSDFLQLVYFAQEDTRNSLEDHSQTRSTVTNIATVAQKKVNGTKEDRSRFFNKLVGSFGPQFASSASSQDECSLRPTLSQQGLPLSGRADRETLPFPEEKLNNGADTSGVSHLSNDPTSPRTLPYFQRAIRPDRKSQTENPTLSPTKMSWTDSAMTPPGTDFHRSASTETFKHKPQDIAPQMDHNVSDSRAVLTISSSAMPSLESNNTIMYPLDGAIESTPKDQQALPWTSWQSTDRFNSALTFDPLKSSTKPPQHDSSSANTNSQPTQSSFSPGPSGTRPSNSHLSELNTTVVEAASVHPHTSRGDSSTTDVPTWTAASKSFDRKFGNADVPHFLASSTQSPTNTPGTPVRTSYTSSLWKQTLKEDVQNNTRITTNTILFSSDKDVGQTLGFAGSLSTPRAVPMTKIKNSVSTATTTSEGFTQTFSETVPHDNSSTDSTPLSSSTTKDSSVHPTTLRTHFPHGIYTTFTSSVSESSQSSQTPRSYYLPSFTNITAYKQSHNFIRATYTSLPLTTKSNYREVKAKKKNKFRQWSTTSGPTLQPSQRSHSTFSPSGLISKSTQSSTSPMFYVVPNQAATIRVDSVELLLQIVVEDFRSASPPRLEEDTAAWVQPYLQRAPGFSELLGVWSSGHAVQSLVVFKTSGALQWLSVNGHMSLLEQTGLAQAVHEGRTFRSSKITNITLGGLQGEVCDWLLQCPAGYKCTSEPGTTNYSCSSVCRFDYCHHHGICTHHPGQLPVCRCLVGDDFWYMGQRCDMRMTRGRLVGACLTILLIVTTAVGILAFVAVRHYRAILIQAKVDQTRSSYRKFNHFDELSGRFWLRSWAGSADSLDNPAFTRSDELMHLRALDRPCCYHDDTLSLASTCPSHGAHINTIYPHSSQYGWRGSGMSMGDGVLDSGKASDLSVCSWPVEPIHWTPFPLLQHLASHRTPRVTVTRPRSYCEGMELVDLGKSWTA